jgi:CubicO group peptidase (beta-lactamase class C family)
MEKKANELLQILNKTIDDKKVFGCNFAMKYQNEIWHGTAGNFDTDDSYFIASTTKLFTTALILNLRATGALSLNDPIHLYLDKSIIHQLLVLKATDFSEKITIQHLLSHTSGLADYFQDKESNGNSWEDELKQGRDKAWTLEDVISKTKNMRPKFAPGSKGKAHYSDTNFQLLGKIIETISGKNYTSFCEEIILKPLQLKHTYMYGNTGDQTPHAMYFKNSVLNIPLAMASFKSDGGMVSNTKDLMTFTEAFFKGQLFPYKYLSELQVWNNIFFPMQSGIGIHRFKLPWIFNPTGAVPELIGHSGLSGTLAYYSPKHDLFIVGTVNQIAYPDISFKTAIKLIRKAL